MASSMLSSTATVSRNAPAQASMVAPFTGLKSTVAFPGTRKSSDITTVANNGGRTVSCIKVWPTEGLRKFETLSYLPTLTEEQLLKQVEYLLKLKLIPCLEFEKKVSHTSSARTTGAPDTMMDDTGQCGSFPCSDARTPSRCSRR
ncbi:ribulose bisphosphate carboxylase small subunit, chloroplastic-like isoform X2 [Henckelia pumila]|uniref:ribulose bisphosphate carboxylase small subunit, chloroplastic-like isoform X2 n=1 Tax=Henckelia pumila TaxID=405737 RepID=UPI003C6E74DD